MPITFGANIASLQVKTQLDRATKATTSNFERLSSGLRINKASDDVAGLLVATGLHTDAAIYSQAVRNINDGLSYVTTAESAADSLQTILQRMSELAEQASNGAYTDAQRSTLDDEFQALKDEYGRIIESTKFNGRAILTETELADGITIQAGHGTSAALSFSFDALPEIAPSFDGDGTFNAMVSYDNSSGAAAYSAELVDLNNDGKLDFITGQNVFIGNGDGSFLASVTYTYGGIEPRDIITGDFNNDGKVDFIGALQSQGRIGVFLGNGDGSFAAGGSYNSGTAYDLDSGDFNGDGKLDIVTSDYLGSTIRVLIGNGDGTFDARTAYSARGATSSVEIGDFNNDTKLDIIARDNASSIYTVQLYLGNGDGTFLARSTTANTTGLRLLVHDLDGDGNLDFIATPDSSYVHVVLGNGDGTFDAITTFRTSPAVTYGADLADVNSDGKVDLISYGKQAGFIGVLLGNGNGTFNTATAYENGFFQWGIEGAVGDVDGDGVLDIIVTNSAGGFTANVFLGNGIESELSISTVEDAQSALTVLDTYRVGVDSFVAELGAVSSRLSTASSYAATRAENARAAEERITSVDVAEEVAQLVRNQVLSQAATALLAQANQQPQIALSLLQDI